MSSDIAIQVEGLNKCYHIYDKPHDRLKQMLMRGRRQYFKEFWALRDVSFEIKKGETVGIIGRNGSGKSTLLQMICGTLNPTSGTVRTNGRIAALLELGAGFNPEFTGRENVYMNGAILGLTEDQVDARFEEIAAFADIGDFIEQPVKTYSSGMFVRLAFSVITHVDADILVIDEALAVGDAQFTQKCMRWLRKFKENGTLVFVSHDSGAVRSLCDQAMWIEHGRVQAIGDAKSVTEKYLASLFNQSQSSAPERDHAVQDILSAEDWKDQRQSMINGSTLRNDIQVMQFTPESASFGQGGVEITQVVLEDREHNPLSWVVGGEAVSLVVQARALVDLQQPIVGFFLKDKHGQTLFGDNTYLTYLDAPPMVSSGERFRAVFSFPMPILPVGDYSFDVAIAEGTQLDHRQLKWGHDVLIVRSVSTSVSTGLVGIPMLEVAIEVDANED